MKPENGPPVKAVFHTALSLPPTQRAAFLERVCGADASLRAEVESLLAASDGGGPLLATPVLPIAPPLDTRRVAPGQMIGRYRVLSLLGSGGMGEVYLAQDPRLGRRIALKILPRELSHDPDRLQRLEREARAASRLAHPNVCVIHEIADTDDGRRFIAMEYVEGESLRTVLGRHRSAGTRMAPDEAIDVVLQAAAGLGAAHAAGIVHRDVKPENLMRRPDGLVKVLDFGVAKLAATESLAEAGSGGHTEPGTLVGTARYMSTEQVRGLPVDSRTDVWSLGVVLFELLTGDPPFGGETAAHVLVSILDRQPRRLADLAPELPSGLQEIVDRALSKDPEARYPGMKEFASDLTRQRQGTAVEPRPGRPPRSRPGGPRLRLRAALVTLGVVLGGGAVFGLWRRSERAPAGDVRLAVLPFENLGDPAGAPLAQDLSDRLRANLMRVSGLLVTPRGSSRQYDKIGKSPRDIGRELGVEYLLRGTAHWRKKEGRVPSIELTSQLVRAASGTTTWQRTFDIPLDEVFQAQTEIASRVAQALHVSLTDSARKQLAEAPTRSPQAYAAYLMGLQAERASGSTNDPPSLRRAIDYYRQATGLDSDFVEAWSQLSQASSALYDNTAPTAAIEQEARRSAERALALAPNRAHGYLAMAAYHTHVTHQQARVLLELAKTRELAPRDVDLQAVTLTNSGYIEKSLGLWDSAAAHFERVHALEPREFVPLENLAEVQLWLRHYPEARKATDLALALLPGDLSMIQRKVMIALAEGDLAGARAVLATAPQELDSAKLVAWMAEYQELMWVLSDAQQRLLVRLRPEAFDDDRGDWGLALAQTLWLRGERPKSRIYADSARMAYEAHVRAEPEDAVSHVDYGLSLAMLGRRTAAVQEGLRATALLPLTKNPYDGAYVQHQLVRIYILVGEPEKALDQLEPLLKIPYYLSPGWLKVDPTFDPIRKNPRFQRLVAGK